MDGDESDTMNELIPRSTPVGGQRALVSAIQRQKALQPQPPAYGQASLTPMGSKPPEQRAREQAALIQALRNRTP